MLFFLNEAERPKQVRPTDNLKQTGEFTTVEKTTYKAAERPKQVKPSDNLKPEGDFFAPKKSEFKPAERAKPVRPVDNLKVSGEFEGKRKTDVIHTKIERTEIKKHKDQITLNEGRMETDTTNTASFKKLKPAQRDVINDSVRKQKMRSNITLGDDTTILRTTNQMNYNTVTTRKDQREVIEKSTDVTDRDRIKDGTIAITTMKVTTVLEHEKDHTPIKEIVRSAGQTKVREEVVHKSSSSNVVNKQNIVNKQEQVNEINQNVVHRKQILNEHDVNNVQRTTKQTSSTTDVNKNVVKSQQSANDIHDIDRHRTVGTTHGSETIIRKSGQTQYSTNVTDTTHDRYVTDFSSSTRSIDNVNRNDTSSNVYTSRDGTLPRIGPNDGHRPDNRNVTEYTSTNRNVDNVNRSTTSSRVSSSTSNVITSRDGTVTRNPNDGYLPEDRNIDLGSTTRNVDNVNRSDTNSKVISSTSNVTTSRNVTLPSIGPNDGYRTGTSSQNVTVEKRVTSSPTGRQEHYTYESVSNADSIGGTNVRTSKNVVEKSTSQNVSSGSNQLNQARDRSTTETSRIDRVTGSSTPLNRQQNYASDILNVQDVRSAGQTQISASQSDKINTQLNLRQHESNTSNVTSTSTTRYNKTSSTANNHSSSNISNILHDSQSSCPVHHQPGSTSEIQRRDYVSSNASTNQNNQALQSHHRKNVLTSSTDVNNSVFHRKANLSTNSNEALHSNSMSSTAAIQRKSISNLHDQAIYNTSSDRKSYSSMHRQGKETVSHSSSSTTMHSHQQSGTSHSGSNIVERSSSHGGQLRQSSSVSSSDRAQKIVKKDNLSLGGEFYGKSESKAYGSFTSGHQHHVIDRASVARRSNQSSITLGDGQNHSSSVYRREYAVVHSGPCPATNIEHKTATFKHTRDTKSHKFYKPSLQ